MARYIECARSAIPADVRWDVPRRNQGQIVEIAYANRNPKWLAEADDGDAYKRVTDRSDGSVTYYQKAVTSRV